MCGIALLVARTTEWQASALHAMVSCQSHRGPDDEGIETLPLGETTVGLGQRRLAIIDLSPTGRQPMAHPESGDLLVYNGELYNYRELRRDLESAGERFRGTSDTEVLLHALVRWGPAALRRLRGMFALIWFRRAERSVVLARDPLGIKPLYYRFGGGGMMLAASEVRAILASGLVERKISPRGLASMLAFGAVQDPDTIIEGVRSFPAGCWQELHLDRLEEAAPPPAERYWSPPPVDPGLGADEAARRTREALTLAVRSHLVSDVPIGVFLSSGLDSTIIAGVAAREAPGLGAYTVGFADNPDMSETAEARHTAERFGLTHNDVQVTSAQALLDAERWFDSLDQPSIDGLNTYVVSRAVRRAGITVALSGLGGDELFCGYRSFIDVPRLVVLMRHARRLPAWARVLLAWGSSLGRAEVYRLKLIEIARTSSGLVDLYLQRRRVMSRSQLAALGIEPTRLGLGDNFMPPEAVDALHVDESDPIRAVSDLETRLYAGNMLLRDSDAMGMAHSLEIRVPFFDTTVLDAVMPIPGPVRFPHGASAKHVLRQAFPDLLRPEILSSAKKGFELPIRRWMVGPLRGLCEEALSDLKRSGLLHVKGIDGVWRSFLAAPESPAWSRAFALVVVGAYITRGLPGRTTPSPAPTPTVAANPPQTGPRA